MHFDPKNIPTRLRQVLERVIKPEDVDEWLENNHTYPGTTPLARLTEPDEKQLEANVKDLVSRYLGDKGRKRVVYEIVQELRKRGEHNDVVVAGDMVLDQHIYEGYRHHYSESETKGVKVVLEAGGAALVSRLLEAMFRISNQARGMSTHWASQLAVRINPLPDVPEGQKSFAFWKPKPAKDPPEKQVWRISDQLGFGGADRNLSGELEWPPNSLPQAAKLLVLADGGMSFRRRSNWERFHKLMSNANWIVLKTAWPLMDGHLWTELSSEFRDKLVVLVAAGELRRSAARLCDGLSWDESIESLMKELKPGGVLSKLMHCRHLFVAFDSEGVVWIDTHPEGEKNDHSIRLVYVPSSIEGAHAEETDGKAVGSMSCLTACVTHALAKHYDQAMKRGLDPSVKHPPPPDGENKYLPIEFEEALESGLTAMRDLREKGHGQVREDKLGFPAKRLAKASLDKRREGFFSRTAFFMQQLDPLRLSRGEILHLAREVVRRGPVALKDVPHLKINDLVAVDRREVETLRIVAKVIKRYADSDSESKPLSIGLFGPPGAGKSFAVRQLSKKYCGEKGWKEFNLSQFASPADLVGAFHAIRDMVLENLGSDVIPVAFFDEFDSQKYKWLQYLLAPMQDGKFQELQTTHPVGKCILVFAGGTSDSFEEFGPRPSDPAYADFRALKGPDFLSRLDTYINVVGPNPRLPASAPEGSSSESQDDIYWPLRRALMIRAELKCKDKHKEDDEKIDMDIGLLNALLRVEKYEKNSRSLTKLLQPFQMKCVDARKRRLTLPALVPSMLLPAGQIAMHANFTSFDNLLQQPRPSSRFLEVLRNGCAAGAKPAEVRASVMAIPDDLIISGSKDLPPSGPLSEAQIDFLAPLIHESYKKAAIKAAPAAVIEEFKKASIDNQKSSKAAARRMLQILSLVGLEIVDGRATEDERKIISDYLESYVEILAEAEHLGWMKWHYENNWIFGPTKVKRELPQLSEHHLLVPFGALLRMEQDKDRTTIRAYPGLLDRFRKMIWFSGKRLPSDLAD